MARAGAVVQVGVLGPLRVVAADGEDVTPEGALQKRLLALLVLHRGRVVSTDRAIEALWPTDPPRDPLAALQNHLSRLRQRLPDGLIESVATGYRLDPSCIDLDADRLAAAVAAGATADAAAIADLAAGWSGPAYPELDDLDDGRAEAQRLDELRTSAREAMAAARLAAGDVEGLVAELIDLVADQPLRERPRALLMDALAGSGRQVEALRVYDDFRRLLGDELGIEPSPVLAAQHAALLGGVEAAPTRRRHRIPVPATTMLGRAALVVEVLDRVRGERLLTLLGPGGVGKTRLLLELGRRLAEGGEAVVLAELAAVDAGGAVEAVAAALAIDARPGVPIVDRVADVVGDDRMVVLLDNCEHVLDPVAELVDRLLTACPGVAVIATSRERLRVAGEHVCTVPTLPTDDPGSVGVQLFVERARAVAPDFAPTGEDLRRVAAVVRRLDGLPLAIELAAARLHALDLDEVAAGLDHRFSLLSSGYRTAARHASLEAAIAWSYDLLGPDLRAVLAAVSIFAGPFDATSAAAVCGIAEPAAVAALAQLVERSLVLRTPDRGYLLLESLRAFAGERLDRSGRRTDVAARHARQQVAWMEQGRLRLHDDGTTVLADIDRRVPELQAAFDWLLDAGEVELAGRMVASLVDYGLLRLHPDVMLWSERVVAADPTDASPVAAAVWVVASYAAWMAGDVAQAAARSVRARAVADAAGTPRDPEVRQIEGTIALFEGRLDDAAAGYREASAASGDDRIRRLLAASSELLALGYRGAPEVTARADALLAEVGDVASPVSAYAWYCAGESDLAVDLDRARARLSRALDVAAATNASFVTGVAGASRASIEARVGDPTDAVRQYVELIDHWRRAGMWSTQWTVLRSIAGLLARLGRHHDAAVLEGAVRAPGAGHRIFGADEVALDELGAGLRAALGDDAYAAARREGEGLDADRAVAFALRAL